MKVHRRHRWLLGVSTIATNIPRSSSKLDLEVLSDHDTITALDPLNPSRVDNEYNLSCLSASIDFAVDRCHVAPQWIC